jgi:hypothetical protein
MVDQGQTVYWTDRTNGAVWAMPLDGGPVDIVPTAGASPQGIAVTPTHVYWVDSASTAVELAPKTAPYKPGLFTMGNRPQYVVANGTALYWTNANGQGDAGPSLEIALLADSGVEWMHTAGGSGPNDVALNDGGVYWTTANGIWSASLDGSGSATQFHADPNQPVALAADDTRIYWTNKAGAVQSLTIKQPASPVTLFTGGTSNLSGMAVDKTNVYWVDQGAGQVFRAPINATSPSAFKLADGQSAPARIALDDNFVYWTNSTAGTIIRLAK